MSSRNPSAKKTPGSGKKTPGSGKKSKSGSASSASKQAQSSATLTPDTMTKEQLLEHVKKIELDLCTEREERNYFQLERDKIVSFWDMTKNELSEHKATLILKDRELEELEEKHLVEIKVYKQKVKHLLYEYQNNTSQIQTSHTKVLTQSSTDHDEQLQVLRKEKRALIFQLKEQELSHHDVVRILKGKHDSELYHLRIEFERRAKELQLKFDTRTKSIREELELRRKADIHEIEERKNVQINMLLKNHEKSFSEIKNYYNDITLNNLALINALKEQVEQMKKVEERNEKVMADCVLENKRMSEPLQQALTEGETLRKQLVYYTKDKQCLASTKAHLKKLQESHTQLQWEFDVVQQKFAAVQLERDDLYAQFVTRVVDVQQKSGFQNLMLNKKLEALRSCLEKKDIQLHDLLSHQPNVDPATAASISGNLDSIIDAKNLNIRELQLDLARVTKAHNDVIRTFHAKMVENGIPLNDVTLKPLITNTAILPAIAIK